MFNSDAAIDMLNTSLTPSALKKIYKSVMDLEFSFNSMQSSHN
jgi:hypothetical protein